MTELTHITQCDDPKYLPFAKSRIKALRATGLRYASQSFEVDGVQVKVRVEGAHSYVSIEGGEEMYLCLPHSKPHPKGVTTAGTPPGPVPPTATLRLPQEVDGGVKVKERQKVPTGVNDWRGKAEESTAGSTPPGGKKKTAKPRIITFDASAQRYDIGSSTMELPNIYDRGKVIKTKCFIAGKGMFNCGVRGACIISSEGHSFYVMATTGAQPLARNLYICYRPVAKPEWLVGDTIPVPELWYLTGQVLFSPDGSKYNALMRPVGIHVKKITGALKVQKLGEKYVVAATHTVADLPGTAAEVETLPGETSTTSTAVTNTLNVDYTINKVFQWGTEQVRYQSSIDWVVVTHTWTGGTGWRMKYTVPIAFDYDENSVEIPVTLVVKSQDTHVQAESKSRTGSEAYGAGSTTVTGGTGDLGYLISIDAEHRQAQHEAEHVAWIEAQQLATISTSSLTEEYSSKGELFFGSKSMAKITWFSVTASQTLTYNQRWPVQYGDEPPPGYSFTHAWDRRYTDFQFLALDARTDALVSVAVDSKPASTSQSSPVHARKITLKMAFGAKTNEKVWDVAPGEVFLSGFNHAGIAHRYLDFGFAAGNYASRDGKTFAFSASPDRMLSMSLDITHVSSIAPTGESLTWYTEDKGTPAKPFTTVGPELGFAINPITIF